MINKSIDGLSKKHGLMSKLVHTCSNLPIFTLQHKPKHVKRLYFYHSFHLFDSLFLAAVLILYLSREFWLHSTRFFTLFTNNNMARRIIVLGLILFVIISMASAAKPAEHSDDAKEAAEGPSDDIGEVAEGPSDDIGTTDANDDAAPVGGPVPAGAFSESSSNVQSNTPGSSAASALEISTIAGIATTAAGAAFFF